MRIFRARSLLEPRCQPIEFRCGGTRNVPQPCPGQTTVACPAMAEAADGLGERALDALAQGVQVPTRGGIVTGAGGA